MNTILEPDKRIVSAEPTTTLSRLCGIDEMLIEPATDCSISIYLFVEIFVS